MDPDTSAHLVEKLLTIGGQAGVLYVAIYYLVRTLKANYDSRISNLEKKSDECEHDRRALHEQIHQLQSERIGLLEGLIRESRKASPAEQG